MSGALSHRNFRIFWGGSLVSRCGEGMQEVAEDWLVFVMTGSPFLLGVVAFSKAPARMILGPIFGVLIDRVDRKKILTALYVIRLGLALLYAILVSLDLIRFWHILGLAVMDSLVAPMIRVTRQTIIPDLVPRESLLSAISFNSLGYNTCQVIGPFLGGILIAWLGISAVFFINALSFLGIILSLAMIPIPQKTVGRRKTEIAGEILEGLRFIRRQPAIFQSMVLQFISFLFALPFTRLLPVYAKDILQIGPAGLGLLKGCFAGGNVLGGLILIAMGDVENKERLLQWSSLATGLSLICFAYLTWVPVSLVILALVGFSSMVFRTASLSVIQLNVPDQYRGRIMGLYNMEAGFRSVGGLLFGSSASLIGTPLTVGAGGAIFGTLSILAFVIFGDRPRITTR